MAERLHFIGYKGTRNEPGYDSKLLIVNKLTHTDRSVRPPESSSAEHRYE